LRSIDTSAGIAGKDFGEIRGLWPETAIAFSTAELLQLAAGLKRPHPRKKTRWLLWLEDTSNGRVSPCSSSSSNPIAMLTTEFEVPTAPLHLFAHHTTLMDKENLDYRNS
jgi:hypothetical protein